MDIILDRNHSEYRLVYIYTGQKFLPATYIFMVFLQNKK